LVVWGVWESREKTMYTDGHRFLLQCLMDKPVVTEATMEAMYASARESFPELMELGAPLTAVIEQCNEKLSSLYLEVRMVVNELTSETLFALVSTVMDTEDRFGSSSLRQFSDGSLDLIRAILAEVFTDSEENLKLWSSGNSNLITLDRIYTMNDALIPSRKLKLIEIQDFLTTCEEALWLVRHEQDKQIRYTLGPRGLAEFRPYIEDRFGQSLQRLACSICTQVVLFAVTCSNEECSIRHHYHCAGAWFSRRKELACPTCKEGTFPEDIRERAQKRKRPSATPSAEKTATVVTNSPQESSRKRRRRR